MSIPNAPVSVQSRIETFGPAVQSFELANYSQSEVAIRIELSGSNYFSVPTEYHSFALKSGATKRIPVIFGAPRHGMMLSFSALHEAVATVWTPLPGGKQVRKEIIDVIHLKGMGPSFAPDTLRCVQTAETSPK